MSSTLKKSLRSVWKKDGDSLQDSTSHYSEMPGELRDYKNAQHEKAMTAPIDKEALDDKLRREGLI
tara:strand:+ start:41 stop:238 length:198 start_codon:yes stop_codon:yes gene_type:complete